MTVRRWVGVALLVALAACERPGESRAERELAAAALRGLLAYPRSSVVSVSAGDEAAQVVLTTSAPVAQVATWYRQVLRLNGWELRADGVLADGAISIFADSAARPLWITLKPNATTPGTTYTLVGAVPRPDSSAAAQRSGSSMSSNRIQRR